MPRAMACLGARVTVRAAHLYMIRLLFFCFILWEGVPRMPCRHSQRAVPLFFLGRLTDPRLFCQVEMHKFIAQLLHHFDVEFTNPEQPWTVFTQWFANQHDMHMKITYRGGLKSDK